MRPSIPATRSTGSRTERAPGRRRPRGTRARVPDADAVPSRGSARIGAIWHLPEILREFGLDVREVLETAGVRPDLFDDRDNQIAYTDFGRLLSACEQRSGCDHFALLIGQRTRLEDFGLAGQVARCGDSVGDGLRRFIDFFNLHNTASTLSLSTSGVYARFVYAIVENGMTGTRHFQLGAMTMAFNVLEELCGAGWLPTVVTIASRSPTNLRPCQKFFRVPVRFDSDESAIVFEAHWLERPLPPVEAGVRRQVEADALAQRAAILADFPAAVRRIIRRQLLIQDFSMDQVAAQLGMHRRTLDRHLQRHGVRYGELLESVQDNVARQLLRDTRLQVQQIAESLHFSSAANFATAFRRWTGWTPSEYRRRAG